WREFWEGKKPFFDRLFDGIKDGSNCPFGEKSKWCEFSPYKVGFLKYAAFIRSEDFGSEFFMGRLMTKNPESWICYIEGLSTGLVPYQLTTSEDDLCLADSAYFINTSCPPLLRKERNVDIILSFDYSLSTAFE
ncbi:unnamed protein product, partial [Eretmochelys imbricata]